MKKVLAYLFLCATLLVSCQKEVDISLIEKPASPGTEFVEVSMNLSTEPLSGDSSEGTTKSQMSPSADDAFTGAVLFAFNHSTGSILLDGGSNPCVKVTAEKSFSWSLPRDIAMDIYAIANYDGNIEGIGSLLSNPSLTISDLTSLTFTCTAVSGLSSIPMSGINENVTLNNVNTTISVTVKRLMAKYMFYFNLDEILAAGYTVEATSISACKSNTVVPVFYTGAGVGYAQTNEALLATIDTGTSADLTNLSAGGSSNAVTLYFLENCQGRKDGCSTWSQVDGSGLSGLNLCSYLDVRVLMTKAAVVRNETYKIYLGSNSVSGGTACVSNFDVVRNVAKGIRMNLHTPEDLITWRMKSVTLSPSSIGVGGNATATAIKEKYVNGVASGIESPATVSVWVSSDPSVATVSSGTVTGVAEGTCTITATDTSCEEGYRSATSSTFTVSNVVTYRISSIVYNKTTLDYGETATPTVYRQCYVNGVASGEPEVVPNSYFDWISGTETVATVNSSGVVTASSTNTGSSVITATLKAGYQGDYEAGYYSGIATITVSAAPSYTERLYSIAFSPDPVTAGGTTTMTVYGRRHNGTTWEGEPYVVNKYSASTNNTSIAYFGYGTASGSTTTGTLTITGNNAGSCTISVTATDDSGLSAGYRTGSTTLDVAAGPSISLNPWDFSGNYNDYVGYSNRASQTASYSNTGPEGYFTSYSSDETNCSSSDYSYGNSGATVWVYWNSENTSSSPRSVTIYLRDPDTGAEDYIRCTQDAAPSEPDYFTVSPTSLSWDWDEGGYSNRKTASVSTNMSGTITVSCTGNFTASYSAGTVTVYPDGNNTSGSDYSGTVSVKLNGTTMATIDLSQDHYVEPEYFTVSPDSMSWDWDEGGYSNRKTASVSTNMSGTITVSCTGNFTASYSAGTVTVYPDGNNTSGSDYSGTVSVKLNGTTMATIDLSQGHYVEPDYFTVDPTEHEWDWDESGSGNAKTSSVSTNMSGTISILTYGSTSLTATYSSGTVTMYWTSDNPSTTTDRTATVWVRLNGTTMETITCTQNKKSGPVITYNRWITISGDSSVEVGSYTSNYTVTFHEEELHDGVHYSESTSDVTSSSTITSSNTSVATISGKQAYGVAAGTSYIGASYSTYTVDSGGRVELTVTAPAPVDTYEIEISGSTSAYRNSSISLTPVLKKNGSPISASFSCTAVTGASYYTFYESSGTFVYSAFSNRSCRYNYMDSYRVHFSVDTPNGTLTEDVDIVFDPLDWPITISLYYESSSFTSSSCTYYAEASESLPADATSYGITAYDNHGNSWSFDSWQHALATVRVTNPGGFNPGGDHGHAQTLYITSISPNPFYSRSWDANLQFSAGSTSAY